MDEKQLAAYVADETAWGQFAEAHTTDRLQAVSRFAEGGGFLYYIAGGVRLEIDGTTFGEYASLGAALDEISPGRLGWWRGARVKCNCPRCGGAERDLS